MFDDPRLLEVFFEVQRGLPRQGPGCEASTLQALSLCAGLPPAPQVLDVGCGPGLQTLALARARPGAAIAAVDLHLEYLRQLQVRAETDGAAGRIHPLAADMEALPFPPASFDLIWAEGSAYVMGIGAALARWRPLLRARGYLALTELVWLQPDPPAEVRDFFRAEYPAMTDVTAILERFAAAGYRVRGHFTLPDRAWWEHYYTPLEAKLPRLRDAYAGDPQALAVVAASEREIEMRRRFPGSYGYAFFVAQRDEPGPTRP